MLRVSNLILIILIIFAISNCEKAKAPESVVALVGNDPIHGKISEKDFVYSYELTPALATSLTGLAAKKAHLDQMIDKKLMALEGLKRGLDQDEKVFIPLKWYEEKAVRQQLYREVVQGKVKITDEELREAFVKSETTVRVRHLPAKTREDAMQFREKLLNGGSFYDLAGRAFKDSVLAGNGGDLGYFSFGDMDEAIEQAAFSLKIGQISEPVKSKWAYHIIRVEARKQNAILTENQFARSKYKLGKIIRRRKETGIADKYIKDFMNPWHVRVYGPSILFLLDKAKNETPLQPAEASKLRDSEIGKIRHRVEQHLQEVIVEFDGGQWTIGDFLERLKSVHPDARPTMTSRGNLKDVVARMVRDEFLAQEGYRRGLQDSEYVQEEVRHWQEDLLFNRMRKMLLDTVKVSENELNDFYAKNRGKYVEPVRVNIREIFINDESLAKDLLQRIKRGENFDELAQKTSLRKWAASKGGEFGFFGAGMHGKVGKIALAKNAGDLAGPYEIDDPALGPGFSIFKVLDKKDKRYRTLKEVRKQVEGNVLAAKQNKVLINFIANLKKEYRIEIKEELLSRIQTTDDFAKGRRVEMFVAPRF